MFTTAVIKYTVKLRARDVGANVRHVVEERARSLLEGVCGESGYVRAGSMRMVDMSRGRLGDIDMGKSYSFDASFRAEVCNPLKGMRIRVLVRSVNRFGMLCEGGYYDPDNSMVPVVEVVVVANPTSIPNEVDVSKLEVGDEVVVEILGRNYELRDTRISAFGRTVREMIAAAAESEVDDGSETPAPDSSDDDDDGEGSARDAETADEDEEAFDEEGNGTLRDADDELAMSEIDDIDDEGFDVAPDMEDTDD